MDVYHKVLVKLYEESGGRLTKKIDLGDLVKAAGFHPSYDDIYKQLSAAGWIAEAGRGNVVFITHWGVKEAKKSQSGAPDSAKGLTKEANRLAANAKELSIVIDEFAEDISEQNFKLVEKKFAGVEKALEGLKEML